MILYLYVSCLVNVLVFMLIYVKLSDIYVYMSIMYIQAEFPMLIQVIQPLFGTPRDGLTVSHDLQYAVRTYSSKGSNTHSAVGQLVSTSGGSSEIMYFFHFQTEKCSDKP